MTASEVLVFHDQGALATGDFRVLEIKRELEEGTGHEGLSSGVERVRLDGQDEPEVPA